MNRREAIAALTSIPGLARIHKAEIKPNDVIVCEVDQPITPVMQYEIEKRLHSVWPMNKIVVCERGLHLKVLSHS